MSDEPDFMVPNPDKGDGSLPIFHMKAVQNDFRTAAEGRPIFDNLEYVEIHVPGDRSTLVDRRVKAEDKARWPSQYAAFTEERAQVADGYPLELWSGVDRAQVEELKHFRVHTVEQLAGLSDEHLQRTSSMGGRALRDAAMRFLASADATVPLEKLAAEVASKDATIAELTEQLAEANRIVAKLKGSENVA